MDTNRKLIGAAAFSAALAGGGLVGALLGSPAVSGAQDDGATTSTAPTAGDERPTPPGGPGRPGHAGRGERLATVAELLGISEDDLRHALRDGRSIAQVAEAEGVDVQTVIDALVARATEHLEEVEAALPERVTEMVNRQGSEDRHPRPGRPDAPRPTKADEEAPSEGSS